MENQGGSEVTTGPERYSTIQTGRKKGKGAPRGRKVMGYGREVGNYKALSWLEEGNMKE